MMLMNTIKFNELYTKLATPRPPFLNVKEATYLKKPTNVTSTGHPKIIQCSHPSLRIPDPTKTRIKSINNKVHRKVYRHTVLIN